MSPLPEPHPSAPDDPPKPREEPDPDAARDQLLDDVEDGLRDPPGYLRACGRRWPSPAETYDFCHHEFLHNPRG